MLLALLLACKDQPVESAPPSTVHAVESARLRVGDRTLHLTRYQDESLACGRSGYHSFLLVEGDDSPAPLLVYLHGGGVGYYDDGGYHPSEEEAYNDEETLAALRAELERLSGEDWVGDTVMADALASGWRVLVPSLCDHDMYLGLGLRYPHNGDATVDGLLAVERALDFVEAGGTGFSGRVNQGVVVVGMSAGSVGANALAHRREQEGRPLNGVVLDSLLWSSARAALHASGCTPQQRAEPDFDWGAVDEKLGVYLQDPALYPESLVEESQTPRFNLYSLQDPACCGDRPPLPEAEGYAGNCAFAYAGFDERASGASEVWVVEEQAHGLLAREGAWQARVRDWLHARL